MDTNDWLEAAIADATRRGLPELVPLLESLARSTARLREADRVARAHDTDAATATSHVARTDAP